MPSPPLIRTGRPGAVWILSQALDLIRELQPLMRSMHYHITLGGGVLNEGFSEKDLDLFIIPENGSPSEPRKVIACLIEQLGPCVPLRDSPDYGPNAEPHAKEMLKFTVYGMRIDVFIQ